MCVCVCLLREPKETPVNTCETNPPLYHIIIRFTYMHTHTWHTLTQPQSQSHSHWIEKQAGTCEIHTYMYVIFMIDWDSVAHTNYQKTRAHTHTQCMYVCMYVCMCVCVYGMDAIVLFYILKISREQASGQHVLNLAGKKTFLTTYIYVHSYLSISYLLYYLCM